MVSSFDNVRDNLHLSSLPVRFASTTPKTFYFGMNEGSAAESRAHQDQDIEGKFESEVKFLHRNQADGRPSFVTDTTDDMDDNVSRRSLDLLFFFSFVSRTDRRNIFRKETWWKISR